MKIIRSKTTIIIGAALAIIFMSFSCSQSQEQSRGDIIKGDLGAEIKTKL
jgi:hypothetical protein